MCKRSQVKVPLVPVTIKFGEELPTPKSRLPKSALSGILAAFPGDVYASKVANTNSMEPMIDVGCRCIMLKNPDPDDLIVGDVIIYDKDGIIVDYNRDSDDIIHAIKEIGNDGERFFTLKGYNNAVVDPIKVRDNMIVSVLLSVVYMEE